MNAALWSLSVLVAAIVAWASVWVLRRWGERHLLDVPNARSSHTRPTPRGGGVGIVAAVVLGWGALAFAIPDVRVWPLATAALLIAAVSLLDDVRTIGSGLRFGVHTAAASLALWGYGVSALLALPGMTLALPALLAGALLLFWCVGLTNVYNFMDGIDGIAGGQAVVAGVAWALAGVWLDAPLVAVTGAAVAAGSIGFLMHNWPPARIFLGDVGSAFLGFVFAGLVVAASAAAPAPVAARVPLAALLFVWPFAFDAAFTMARRARRGENLLEAHRSHLYQRQVIAGRSHAATSTLYTGLATISAVAGLLWLRGAYAAGIVALVVLAAVAAVLVVSTARCERSADDLTLR